MFQPQPTAYSPFSSYGSVGSAVVNNCPGYRPASGALRAPVPVPVAVPVAVPESAVVVGVGDVGGGRALPGAAAARRGGRAPGFRGPVFSPVHDASANHGSGTILNGRALNFDQQHQHHHSAGRLFKMEGHINDMEEQQRLAAEYEAQLEGPMVGEKKSSHAITKEYAKADPIYIAKTASLPQRYSHYRPILGDGNCGWRAIGFAYFETLLRLSDKNQFECEIARLISLNNFIENVGGQDPAYFEDMADETIGLLRELLALLDNPQMAEALLIEKFNGEVSPSIIYHLRLLAASTLKGRPDLYQGFIPDGSLEDYCRDLMAVNAEIDHLGMTLLIDALVKPVGIAVEIVYLDRSEGTEVNTHIFQQTNQNGIPINPTGPMIHILYRPSHYDIIYKERGSSFSLQQSPLTGASSNPNIQVNRATSFSHQHTIQGVPSMGTFSGMDMTSLCVIPGFCAPPPSHHGFPAQFMGLEHTYAASPISTSVSPGPPSVGNSSTTSSLSVSTKFTTQQPSTLTTPVVNTPLATHTPHSPFPQTTQLPIHTHTLPHAATVRPALSSHTSMASSQPLDMASPLSPNSSFRPSKYEWEAIADYHEGPVTFQTSTFKNSHYNTAHYNNPNFQPEEWSPDCEETVGGGRKKSA